MKRLTKKEIYQALWWTYNGAEENFGMYAGHPHQEVVEGFKLRLAKARLALEQIRPKGQRKVKPRNHVL